MHTYTNLHIRTHGATISGSMLLLYLSQAWSNVYVRFGCCPRTAVRFGKICSCETKKETPLASDYHIDEEFVVFPTLDNEH